MDSKPAARKTAKPDYRWRKRRKGNNTQNQGSPLKSPKSPNNKTQRKPKPPPETYKSISKEDIAKLPIKNWTGPTTILNTLDEIKAAVQEIFDSNEKHIGFDSESKPCFRKGQWNPPALIQIATTSHVYIFRVLAKGGLEAVAPLLESPDILKTGVQIDDDMKDIHKALKQRSRAAIFHPANVTDIMLFTRTHLGWNGGLKALGAIFLHVQLEKSKRTCRSNWAVEKLTPKQIVYAATDAWASRAIFVQVQVQVLKSEEADGSKRP